MMRFRFLLGHGRLSHCASRFCQAAPSQFTFGPAVSVELFEAINRRKRVRLRALESQRVKQIF